MQDIAIVWATIAWLICWLIDLVIVIARGPVMIDPILKAVVIVVALVVILRAAATHNFLHL